MSLWYEHVFRDGTGIKLVDRPFELVKKEVPTLIFKLSADGEEQKVISCPLYDADTGEDLFPGLLAGMKKRQFLKKKICKVCNNEFTPNSANQQTCDKCRAEMKAAREVEKIAKADKETKE